MYAYILHLPSARPRRTSTSLEHQRTTASECPFAVNFSSSALRPCHLMFSTDQLPAWVESGAVSVIKVFETRDALDKISTIAATIDFQVA